MDDRQRAAFAINDQQLTVAQVAAANSPLDAVLAALQAEPVNSFTGPIAARFS